MIKLLMLADASCIHTQRWANSLNESGISVFLFSLTTFDVTLFNTSIKIYHFGYDRKDTNVHSSWHKLRYLVAVRRIKNLIKEIKPDILHAHYASSYGLLGALAGFHPYIVSVWGSDVYEFPRQSWIWKYVLKYSFWKANDILSTSHIMAEEIKKYTKKPIKITPFGVNIDQFKNTNMFKVNEEYLIGNVKALDFKYGIDILITAFKIIVDKNPNRKLRLEIIGEGPNREELEMLTKDLHLTDKVCFLGKIRNSELISYYNHFSVAVFPSVSESFGVVAIEAMACECPVIASDADGFTEVVVDGQTGFIVPKKDIENTAKAIQRFIDNPELRSLMGRKGRERVLKLYNWDDNVNAMISIYQQIMCEWKRH